MRENIQEFDVFTIPHSRMMQLVNSCNKNLSVTDFADNDALFALLSKLQNIFYEFKTHEDIEDEHIMTKLKSKLKSMAIYNSAVCNCHSNDEFTPLINLVERGYMFINKAISTSERITFGVRLRRALKQFTNKFIPHMKEEEEVFQPLLMEYFTPDELAEMKKVVIKLHLQSRKGTVATQDHSHQYRVVINQPTSPLPAYTATHPIDECLDDDDQARSFNHLPSEIMLKIFSHLSVVERVRIARVCKRWNSLVYDRSNWKELKFSDWSTTKTEPKPTSFKDIDYIDESDEDEFDNPLEIKIYDIKTLQYWIKYLLPRIGTHLTKLDLSNCRSLNNNLARRIIQLCPNLTDLNLSYTPIGDNSFRGVKLDNLKTLNCEGCDKLSDKAFRFLLLTSILSKMRQGELVTCVKDSSQVCKLGGHHEDMESGAGVSDNEEHNCNDDEDHDQSSRRRGLALSTMAFNSLEYINLSGVWSLTDEGLSFIASKYDLTNLRYLNLSGCLNLSGETLEKFLEESKSLAGENLYYCDNIQNGPMSQTANGCDNLGCSDKFCCRAAVN